jgi:hypothetical protein
VQPGAVNPSLLEFGHHGKVEIICDTNAPEDFESTPDNRFLIVSKMGRGEDEAWICLILPHKPLLRFLYPPARSPVGVKMFVQS